MFTDIIWDFDGTLFDTYPGMVRAFYKALKDFEIDEEQKSIYRLMKISIPRAISHFSETYGLDRIELGILFRAYEREVSEEEMRPFLHAKEVCKEIMERGGRSFIFTHRDDSIFKYLKYHGMMDYFIEIITKGSGFKKPDPEGFIYFADKYNIPREQILVVGDRDIEVIGAKNAGMKSCLFNPGNVSCELEPNYSIESLEELYPLLRINY